MPQWIEKPGVVFAAMLLLAALMLHACQRSSYYFCDDELHLRASLGDSWNDFSVSEISALPLARLSYRLDYVLFAAPSLGPASATQDPTKAPLPENWAPWIRRMNALYHVLAGMILWIFLRRIRVGAGLAFVVAVAWAGHPGACESVCWVSERKNVLVALFGFGSLLAWTLPRPLYKWSAVYALFAMALLCKASAIVFIPLLLALEIIGPMNAGFSSLTFSNGLKAALKLAVPVLLGLGMAVLTVKTYGRELVDPPGGSMLTAIFTDAVIFARYIFNALFPIRLSFLYGVVPIVSPGDYRLWLYGVLILLFFGLAVCAAAPGDRKLALFGMFWFFAGLGPYSNLISTPFWMQDRYLYLALPGLLLLSGVAVRGVCARIANGPRGLPYIAGGWLAVVAALLPYRSSYFRNDEKLILQAARQEPLSGQAHLGAARIFSKLWTQHRRNGTQPNPDLERVYGEAAYGEFAQALLCPDVRNFEDPFRIRNFGVEILLQRGQFERAREALQGWLPPPNMIMLKVVRNVDKKRASRRTYLRGYFPQTLAHAWGLMAESSLLQSNEPAKEIQQRIELCKRAAEEADRSIAVDDNESEGALTKARALMQLAYFEAEKGEQKSADAHFADGVKLLQAIPADCLNGPSAAAILKGARPPKPALVPLSPLRLGDGVLNSPPDTQ